MTESAFHTPLIDLLGCDLPILCAGMGGVARHRLAAAVSNAGGFGCLGMVREPVERIRAEVEAYRRLSARPFTVNLIPAATDPQLLEDQVRTCLELGVPAMTLFWDIDAALIRRLKAEGLLVLQQIGSREQAEAALEAGVDVLIAQGFEAGGHVWGQTASFALLPEIVALGPVPVVACGGIASGEALIAALALGAQGVCCGSAFLATHEANAHDYHKQRLIEAGADDTVISERFFRNWPMTAPVRVLPNAVTRGEYDNLYATRHTPVIGEQDGGPIYLFSSDSPLADAQGQLADMPIYAGQSCGQIGELCGAAERVGQLMEQARRTLSRLQGAAAPAQPAPTARAPEYPELADALNELLSAERAGARVAAFSLKQAGEERQRRLLEEIHRGEADSCRRLRRCLLHLGAEPTRAFGAFYEKCMAIADLDERLALVDRGQRWVIRKLGELLPRIDDPLVRRELEAMLETHEVNSELAKADASRPGAD